MSRSPYNVFTRELDAIEKLYFLSLWAYHRRDLGPNERDIVTNADGTLSLRIPGFPQFGTYKNPSHINADLRKRIPRTLRSVLYIRIISALEVFLIDSVKFAFTRNPFLLACQKRLEIPYAKLIAARTLTEIQWDIVMKETRRLHSAGFAEVVKFYSSHLGINFSDIGLNLSLLEKAHDIRHLLVHRLGKCDKYFKDKHGEKKARILVSEAELLGLLEECRNVAVRLFNRLEERIDATPQPQTTSPFVGEITVIPLQDALPPDLTPDFSFVQGDEYLRNSDIFKLNHLGEGTYKYVFHCPFAHYRILRRKLKRASKRGLIEIRSIKGVSGARRKRSTKSKEYLLTVASMLPRRSEWYKGIHKVLAKVIGISNNEASRIVTSILEDRECLEALGRDAHKNLMANNAMDADEE
jgi:hypothetical protein